MSTKNTILTTLTILLSLATSAPALVIDGSNITVTILGTNTISGDPQDLVNGDGLSGTTRGLDLYHDNAGDTRAGQYRGGTASGASGFLYVDDIGLCRGTCVPAQGPSQDLNGDCIVNFADHAVKAQTWTGNMSNYRALAEEWLSELLIWP